MDEFEPFEQQDFLEAERKELLMRYIEQSNFVYATAKDEKSASSMIERLRSEFFIGYNNQRKVTDARRTQELLDMQAKTYQITPTATGGILEIQDKK